MFSLIWLKNPTAKKYLHSYLIISIIPVFLVCLILGLGTGYTMRRQAENAMQSQLEQLKNELDASITYMENSALHLSGILSAIPPDTDPVEFLGEEWVVSQLKVYQENLSLPSEVIYYPRTGTTLYTTSGQCSYHDFETTENWAGQLEMSQFYTKLNTITNRTFLSTSSLNPLSNGSYLAYLYPLPNMDVSPIGTIAFLLPREHFDTLVQDYCGDLNGYFMTLDSFYGISYQVDQWGQEDMDQVARSLSLSTGGGISHTMVEEEPFVFIRTVSKNYGFTYLYAVPERELYEQANHTMRLIFLASALLLGVLLVLSVLTAANRMKPVIRLAGELIPDAAAADDLFEQIHLQFQSMEQQNDKLQLQLSSQHTLSRYRILSEILYGWRGDQEQLASAMEQTGIVFPYSHFLAAVIQPENDSPLPPSPVLRAYERLKSHDSCAVFFLEARNTRPAAFLFNVDRAEGVREQLAQALETALAEESVKGVRIGIGGWHSAPVTANASYCEALVALQDPLPVNFFEKSLSGGNAFLCPSAEGKLLQQSLLSGSEETAADILRKMSAVVEKHQQLPLSMVRCYCFYVTSLLLQSESMLKKSLPKEELLFAANHADLSLFTFTAEAIIRQTCREITLAHQTGEEAQAAEILRYVETNFGDYTLSVETLSQHFDLSERMVRQIIKEQTGSSLSTLLTTLRMNYIKEQLAQTDLSVRELIERVGYTDVSSFTRKFRQLEGVTPGQYRSMMQSGSAAS